METPESEWTPPFCSNEVEELECPHCEDGGAVCVRERETYFDSNTYDAYCAGCHALLEVTAVVDVAFCDVEAVPSDHAHLCPECCETKRCLFACSLAPMLGKSADGLPLGSPAKCDECADSLRIGEEGETKR